MSRPANQQGDPLDNALSGRVFGSRYQLVDRLGAGAAGVVYLARDLESGVLLAVKVLCPGGTSIVRNAADVDQFLNEALTVSRLGSPHVVDIYGGGVEDDGTAFLAMEYLPGIDLHRFLQSGAVPWPRLLPIVQQSAAALATVHKEGMVHGDVKPANIFLTTQDGRNDFVKILDFGLARTVRDKVERGVPGEISGTPAYMAPEQALGRPVGPAADVYSLGCVLYHMLTGTPVFSARNLNELLAHHIHSSPQPPSARRPDLQIGTSLDAVVAKALAKDPGARWPSMETFGEALGRCRLAVRAYEEMPPASLTNALRTANRRSTPTSGWLVTVYIAMAVSAFGLYLVERYLLG
jgi:serine/threonine-protein kinase